MVSGNRQGRQGSSRFVALGLKDIQQLKISSKSLSVLTYKDNKWKLGADRKYEFKLVSGQTFERSYAFLKTRLDQRFVAELAERSGSVLWEIPVKHLRRFSGDEGLLRVGADVVIYSSLDRDASRTWRYQDIDNISSSGPFQLTITTFERAKGALWKPQELRIPVETAAPRRPIQRSVVAVESVEGP